MRSRPRAAAAALLLVTALFLVLFSAGLRAQHPLTPPVNPADVVPPGLPLTPIASLPPGTVYGHYLDGDGIGTLPGTTDLDRHIVMLSPGAGVTANGAGLIYIDSSGFRSHDTGYWQDPDGDVRQFNPYLAAGYHVFILCHPDGKDFYESVSTPTRQPTDTHEPWVIPEIQEYLLYSIYKVKQLHDGVPAGETLLTKWAIRGGSAGAYLALNLGLTDPTYQYQDGFGVTTGVDAIIAGVPGCDLLNYRFPGDYGGVYRFAAGIFHPDYSGLGGSTLPAPTYPPIPHHLHDKQLPGTIAWPLAADVASFYVVSSESLLPLHASFPEECLTVPFAALNGTRMTLAQVGDPAQLMNHLSTTNTVAVNQAAMASASIYQPAIPASVLTYVGTNDLLSKFSANDPPVLHLWGTRDFIQYEYQQTLISAQATAAGIDYRPIPRPGLGHGWRDIDGEDEAELIAFLDDVLLGLPDADRDRLPDVLDADDTLPDQDGDGQNDLAEYGQGTWDQDATSVFRIDAFLYSLNATTGNWDIELRFNVPPNVQSTPVVLQECAELARRDVVVTPLGSFEGRPIWEPLWADANPIGLVYTAPGGTVTYHRLNFSITPAMAVKNFYRLGLATPAGGFVTVVTEPIGIRQGRIVRSTTGTVVNHLAPAFERQSLGRTLVGSATQNAVDPLLCDLLFYNAGQGAPAFALNGVNPGPDPNLGTTFTNCSNYRYYLKVEDDESVSRPTAIPDERGLEGHWWFVDGVTTSGGALTGLSVRERALPGTALTRADQMTGQGQSVSIRPLVSLADLFAPYRNPANPNQWRAYDSTIGAASHAATPFHIGDKIIFVKRDHVTLNFSLSGTQPTTPPLLTLQFQSTASRDWGKWCVAGTTTARNLDDLRFRPDEAVQYLAVAYGGASLDSNYVEAGFVATADVVAYLNADAGVPSPTNPTTPKHGLCLVGWRFPEPSFLQSRACSDGRFFRDNPYPISVNGVIPDGSQRGSLLFWSDPDFSGYLGDDPFASSAWATFGEQDGDHAYFFDPMPSVRGLRVYGGNLELYDNRHPLTGDASPIVDRQFLPGRGYAVLTNDATGTDPVPVGEEIREWRLRRPYRKP
ncbi:MAG: hypothetical protein H6807_06175 [Planctomycetes bacterium]|nr:hypothetical protein [Planctomycetota bacterium]